MSAPREAEALGQLLGSSFFEGFDATWPLWPAGPAWCPSTPTSGCSSRATPPPRCSCWCRGRSAGGTPGRRAGPGRPDGDPPGIPARLVGDGGALHLPGDRNRPGADPAAGDLQDALQRQASARPEFGMTLMGAGSGSSGPPAGDQDPADRRRSDATWWWPSATCCTRRAAAQRRLPLHRLPYLEHRLTLADAFSTWTRCASTASR